MKTAIKKTVIISLIITLMSTYFVIIGQTMSIALSVELESQGEDTNANNVKFEIGRASCRDRVSSPV